MRLLGLPGILLWLGTLLADAGSAERARVEIALADERSIQVLTASLWGDLQAADADYELSTYFTHFAVYPAADFRVPDFGLEWPAPRGAWRRASRHLLLTWHFGQGPPVVGLA